MTKKDRYYEVGGFWSDYPGVGIVKDVDVAKYARKHLRFMDRFSVTKVAQAALFSQDILFKVIGNDELPKAKNWKFKFHDYEKKGKARK